MDSHVNYQLLQVLKVLLEEEHITKASERLNISQPAMSIKLKKLRQTFDDELLVRTSLGMKRTSRADELLAKITPLLVEVEELFISKKTFNPDTYHGKFNIGTCDHLATILLTKLNRSPRLSKLATKLQIYPLSSETSYDALRSGRLDVALGYSHEPLNHIAEQYLFTDKKVLLVDENSEFALKKEITIQDYLDAEKICFSQKHNISIRDLQITHRRKGDLDVLTTYSPFMFGSINLLKQSNKILVSTKAYFDLVCATLPVVCIQPTWLMQNDLAMKLFWFKQPHETPNSVWLRNFLQNLLSH